MPFGKKQIKKLKAQKITDLKKKKRKVIPTRHVHDMHYHHHQTHYSATRVKEFDVWTCSDLRCHYSETK